MTAAISTSFLFLQRDPKWNEEKPYHVLFDPPEGLQKSNLNLQQVNDINVHNIRERDSPPTIEKKAFTLIKMDPRSLRPDEFDDNEKVAKSFLPRAARARQPSRGSGIDYISIHSSSHSHILDARNREKWKKGVLNSV
ncbi:hypothetical protein BKA61DRAFT_481491 [Leptodontidium sp. MPI-SDFR-AT-0119]|nr:hypothetical protein BKA61DRAFT_481491 [Leptodontidium sp. MPI-SDFR-AT-0119]